MYYTPNAYLIQEWKERAPYIPIAEARGFTAHHDKSMLNVKDIEKIKQVAEYYNSPECSRRLQAAAEKFGYTRSKIRKILVTTGDYETEQTKLIQEMEEQGRTVKEISEQLGISPATVSSSLPYRTLFYGSEEPSEHAAAVRQYRAYEKRQKIMSDSKFKDLEEYRRNDFIISIKKGDDEKLKTPKPSRKKGDYLLPKGLIRLNVRLEKPYQEEEIEALRKYAGVERGNTISRDIIVPENMPLRALHYTLQRAFGFRDYHLHCFELFSNDLAGVSGNSMKNLLNLCGVVFTNRPMKEEYDEWEPRYGGGSFVSWLRSQYTWPWNKLGDWLDDFHAPSGEEDDWPLMSYVSSEEKVCRLTRVNKWDFERYDRRKGYVLRNETIVPEAAVSTLKEGTGYVKITNPKDYYNVKLASCDPNDPDAMRVENLTLGELDIDNGLRYRYETPTFIIERLPIKNVLAVSGDYLPYDDDWNHVHTVTGLKQPQIISDEEIQCAIMKEKDIMPKPFTDVLLYRYDWGDNWKFFITGSRGCSDLVEQGIVTESELTKAVNKIYETDRPVLLARNGDMLIEDAGNISGFINFLEFIDIPEESVIQERYPESKEFIEYTIEEPEKNTDEDEDDDSLDENGFSRTEIVNWAVMKGWHRNDFSNINLI